MVIDKRLIFGVLTCFSARVIAADTHCTIDERVIFSCSTGNKIVSVCAAKNIASNAGYLQYRYGKLGHLDMQFPAEKLPANPSAILANTLTFAGGGGAYLRFNKGDYSYVVYTAIGRGWGEKAGVVVEKNQQQLAKLICKTPAISELGIDLFQQAGLANDILGFELP